MYMLEMGKQTNNFFSSYTDEYGRKRYRLKSIDQYSRENNTNEQPGKKYFAATTLPDIIKSAAGSGGKGKLTENDKGESPIGALCPNLVCLVPDPYNSRFYNRHFLRILGRCVLIDQSGCPFLLPPKCFCLQTPTREPRLSTLSRASSI